MDEEGPRRRQWSAGHALIVSVLALAIGLLLNAPGIHKSAYNKPDGWQRDVALAVAEDTEAGLARELGREHPLTRTATSLYRWIEELVDAAVERPGEG